MDEDNLTVQELYELGNGDETQVSYDFSVIPADLYERFFRPLSNLIYKKVDTIRFSCDLNAREEKQLNKNMRSQKIIEKSIMKQRPNYSNYLFKILSIVLPKSKRLKYIHISNFKIPSLCVDELFDALHIFLKQYQPQHHLSLENN